ncbi:MAG: hypothetical protein Q4B26_14800 [Eubacteriales bacterium]|nr:hypothetical protein [Eubacteriales bacterium]
MIKFDNKAQTFFFKNPGYQATVCQCKKCGLFYIPDLGHEREGGDKNGKERKAQIRKQPDNL